MFKIVAGFLLGVLTSTLLFCVFGNVLSYPAYHDLVEQSRLIKFGMSTDEVCSILGNDNVTIYECGKGFPKWASAGLTEDYWKDHGLITRRFGRFRPQLLLVYFDIRGRVTFVSSTYT